VQLELQAQGLQAQLEKLGLPEILERLVILEPLVNKGRQARLALQEKLEQQASKEQLEN
jgi:hypothetical protein